MKIEYACLRRYKRLFGSRIAEFEATFPHAVQIIVGSNSSGKTSLMRELSPLPSVRTDYEKDGYKELHISHNNHQYVLISDFSNRTSPHSFQVDGVELNVGHTSQVQEELAVKHFGFTTAVRDLVYGKTKICDMTPMNRKNMFLNLNPLDLSLIVSTFKAAYGAFKDNKANVALLNTRKASLEANMLPEEVLAEHKKTKASLEQRSSELDKLLFAIEQHLSTVQQTYREDISFYEQCQSQQQPVIPNREILEQCHTLLRRTIGFSEINRETYREDLQDRQLHYRQLTQRQGDLTREISDLSTEIDDYEKHLAEVAVHDVQQLEQEVLALTDQLAQFKHLPEAPIPSSRIEEYVTATATLEQRLHIWADLEVQLEDPTYVQQQLDLIQKQEWDLKSRSDTLTRMNEEIKQLEAKLAANLNQVPVSCQATDCKLLQSVRQQQVGDRNILTARQKQRDILQQEYDTALKAHQALVAKYEKHQKYHILSRFRSLFDMVSRYYPQALTEEAFISILNADPLRIVKTLNEYITGSKGYHEFKALEQLRDRKQSELKALQQSEAGASKQFLTKQLELKRQQSATKLQELKRLESEVAQALSQWQLYQAYDHDRQQVSALQQRYQKGLQALKVVTEVKFWQGVRKFLTQEKQEVNAKLVELASIVREQEVIQRTYESETIKLLHDVSQQMELYDKVASALSPNSGIAHKSMVRYLNAMIENVNYFISQLWNFKLQLQPLDLAKPLSYQFPIDIESEIAPDINRLSDGQTEIVDFTWSLAILLQLKMLHQIPLYADELGRACDVTHRNKILLFLNSLVDNSLVEQVFLINHYAALQEGFTNSDVICLNADNLGDLPSSVNENVKLVKF